MGDHTFIDLFSGGGGMSAGFAAHGAFRPIAAFDAEIGKPSTGKGSLGCNDTYALNMGVIPRPLDLANMTRQDIQELKNELLGDASLSVLLSCPPCTGFSRANPNNHLKDDARNSLVAKTSVWVDVFAPSVVVMENARELISGNFTHHYRALRDALLMLGYDVHASVHRLDQFGLPQRRERALIVATKQSGAARGLESLWRGFGVSPKATTVRRAIGGRRALAAGEANSDDPFDVSPRMGAKTLARLQAIPRDGGSWRDLVGHPCADELLTPSMLRSVTAKKLGSHPDLREVSLGQTCTYD